MVAINHLLSPLLTLLLPSCPAVASSPHPSIALPHPSFLFHTSLASLNSPSLWIFSSRSAEPAVHATSPISQQEGRPALMRIPIIGPNQHTGPRGPALPITNESVEPTDRKTQFLFSAVDPCMLHPLIFTVGACVRMLVHRYTWARYLLATLLGLAVGQNNRRALTFPSSPNPTPSPSPSLRVCWPSKNMPVRSRAICMRPSCHPPPPLSSTFYSSALCAPIPNFRFSISPHLILPSFWTIFPLPALVLTGLWRPL
ncbi:unnamed protein product [Pleuronectes platessa]|uniref:Uncharacterized protein n=1 Tax=Pleuronectes platessa TaxID=8262 RepID=A0A9N7VK11_PLEPL|nr:unnamed protein product [Pleuronectes platessa]